MSETGRYVCVPLTSDTKHLSEIQEFVVDREAEYANDPDIIRGLEAYLKRAAWEEDLDEQVKVYLIKDTQVDGMIAAYFALRTGMVGDNELGEPPAEDVWDAKVRNNAKAVSSTLPGIEISHFAVNDNYRRAASKSDEPVNGLGYYFYPAFIFPIIEDVAKRVGVKVVYLFAADEDEKSMKLVRYYENAFGFQLVGDADLIPMQPGYDGGCYFMYMIRP